MLCHEENVEEINATDFWKYRLIGLYEPGKYAEAVPFENFDSVLIEDSLNEFMRDDCLMVKADALASAAEGSLVKNVMQIFNALPKRDAYVAVISMRDDSVYSNETPVENKPLALHYHCEPIIPRELDTDSDFSGQYVLGVFPQDFSNSLKRRIFLQC